MTPREFIAKWRDSPLTERAGAQAFFLDLCELLAVEKPNDPDNYCFERGATRTGAGHGWADVWKRGCFAWENKAPGRDLGAALKQLMTYALALDNPPLLVVCDREIIQIHTHFTGTPSEVHTIALADIGLPENLDKLRRLFDAPDSFRPHRTSFAVTEEAAARMGGIARRLAERGDDPLEIAHFLIQCVFCMFAEDARLLPEKLFETVLDKSNPDGAKAQSRLAELFRTMTRGGDFALHDIPWFNGGLFAKIGVPVLTTPDVVELLAAARMDWRAVEPAILGTLFERGLNPDMRSQLGAHYTDPATIMKLIRPVIEAPLRLEWEGAKAVIARAKTAKAKNAAFIGYLERLKNYRVLDPACGSGNFLYLALKTLKDLEHRANLEAETLGLHRQVGIETSPANVLGIELNPYAAELARVTVWIGEIQWMLDHGYAIRRDPILAPLDHIECRDAVLSLPSPSPTPPPMGEGLEPQWPAVDAIVGNPPFLGDKKMRGEMGGAYVDALRGLYQGRVPGGADLVAYWFEKARAHLAAGRAHRAGLVATNSIRGGANRKVLERIVADTPIFEAWSDEAWINNGAAVRVSLVCFGPASPSPSGGGVGEGAEADRATLAKPPLPETLKHHARTLRKTATDAEQLLWSLLRGNQLLGFGFRRQHPLGPYILDFYCHRAKLAVELDGGQHGEPGQRAYDEQRGAYLAARGIVVLRFWNNEVLGNTEGVLQVLFDRLGGAVATTASSAVSAFGSPLASSFPSPSSPSPTPPPEGEGLKARLDGVPVAAIHADLTAGAASGAVDLTLAKRLEENTAASFIGGMKKGSFDIPGERARAWLAAGGNPNGRRNGEVVLPWANGLDITRRPTDTWIVDFGVDMPLANAMLFEAPFQHVLANVKPARDLVRNALEQERWWLHARPAPDLRRAIAGLPRFIATARVAKYRLFVWLRPPVVCDGQIVVIARADDTTFGILHSRFHELWSLGLCTWLGVGNDPRYTPTTTFETFPFPAGLTPRDTHPSTPGGGAGEGEATGEHTEKPEGKPASEPIAAAARRLNTLRETWLNPPEWVDWARAPEEEQAGFPARPVAKPGHEAELKRRTLTNLYNQRPAWLDHAHRELDAAVAAAYGWADYTPAMADGEILRRLLALNLERGAEA